MGLLSPYSNTEQLLSNNSGNQGLLSSSPVGQNPQQAQMLFDEQQRMERERMLAENARRNEEYQREMERQSMTQQPQQQGGSNPLDQVKQGYDLYNQYQSLMAPSAAPVGGSVAGTAGAMNIGFAPTATSLGVGSTGFAVPTAASSGIGFAPSVSTFSAGLGGGSAAGGAGASSAMMAAAPWAAAIAAAIYNEKKNHTLRSTGREFERGYGRVEDELKRGYDSLEGGFKDLFGGLF